MSGVSCKAPERARVILHPKHMAAGCWLLASFLSLTHYISTRCLQVTFKKGTGTSPLTPGTVSPPPSPTHVTAFPHLSHSITHTFTFFPQSTLLAPHFSVQKPHWLTLAWHVMLRKLAWASLLLGKPTWIWCKWHRWTTSCLAGL